jgi:hypothetical protein
MYRHDTHRKPFRRQLGYLRLLLVFPLLLLGTAGRADSSQQVYFDSPETAADALVVAVARHESTDLGRLLGPDYRQVLPLDEIDAADVARFLDAWIRFHTLVPEDPDTRVLAAGDDGWTLPIPIVREAEGWRFDTAAGAERMRIRHIGRNELAVMQAVFAYHDAQIEYALNDHDGDGLLEYAQRFISTPGSQDGLYWDAKEGAAQSPLGPLFDGKVPQKAYHGYLYRILTSQGEHAPGGARDYLADGNLTGGFALIAWPAVYGESGVMSFMLSRQGILYEADLGPDGGADASALKAFDPDSRWRPVASLFAGALP